MNVVIHPAILRGSLRPPCSKSVAHRVIIARALSGFEGKVRHLTVSEDLLATDSCTKALLRKDRKDPLMDCGESGSTLRFMIPIALAVRGRGRFTGRARLLERPLGPYLQIFEERGITWERAGNELVITGKLTPGTYSLAGNVSSQFITGLLFALPMLEGDSEIVLTTPLESRGYVDLTLQVMEQFGVRAQESADGSRFVIPGKQRYQTYDADIEPDWSQAAFYYALQNLGCPIKINGMNPDSLQGDKVIAQYAAQLAEPGDVTIDVSQCPDLVPPLAAMAAVRRGTCSIVNAARLRLKESDRLATVSAVLTALGADIQELPDGLVITGKPALAGGVDVESYQDHRIAMMTAVLAVRCANPVRILGAQCVAKSFPKFWEIYQRMHGNITIEEEGAPA